MRAHKLVLLILSASAALLASCDAGGPLQPAPKSNLTVLAVRNASELAAPSNASAIASIKQIDVGWRDNSGNESSYELYRSASDVLGDWALLASINANVVTYIDQGLDDLTEYCYKVRAVRVTGKARSYSTFSNVACAMTPPPPSPPPPPPSAASDVGVTAWSNVAEVRWRDNSTNEWGFRVYRSTDGGATWVEAASTANTSISDYGRTLEQPVCYHVVAFNPGGDSAPSSPACVTPIAGVTNLIATRIDAETVRLTWSDASAFEESYTIWLQYTSCCGNGSCDAFDPYAFLDIVGVLPANATSFTYATNLASPQCAWFFVVGNGVNATTSYQQVWIP